MWCLMLYFVCWASRGGGVRFCCFVLSLVGAGGGRDRPRDIILQLLRLCARVWLTCLYRALQDQSCKTALLLLEEDRI